MDIFVAFLWLNSFPEKGLRVLIIRKFNFVFFDKWKPFHGKMFNLNINNSIGHFIP